MKVIIREIKKLREEFNLAGRFIIKELIKFIRETLQENNIYSSKKTMVAQSFLICTIAFLYETMATGRVNIEIFNTFAYLAFGASALASGTTLISKKIDNPTPPQEPGININTPESTNINIENKSQ